MTQEMNLSPLLDNNLNGFLKCSNVSITSFDFKRVLAEGRRYSDLYVLS